MTYSMRNTRRPLKCWRTWKQAASSSSETITTLKAQLEEAKYTTNKAETEQLQQRLEVESNTTWGQYLSVLRKKAKESSATIQGLLKKMKKLETNLDSAALTQPQKENELATLTDALQEKQQAMLL
ncbi:hypothetical protein PI124_g525 [Phytophthora idaei]|nr:hypothetical protein PI125_g11084 [Phytophthora idaei]KAG3138381.1 hypothetical protein PI126_g16947 [Phytophthora idaei]KAG3254897.1 hypothetical protein PI124_g525 [Phytophthora idaei]